MDPRLGTSNYNNNDLRKRFLLKFKNLSDFGNFPNAHKTKSAKAQEMPQTFAKKVEE